MVFYYNSLIILFATILYMMMVDKNVGDYILLVFKLVNSLIIKASMYIKLHPIVTVNFFTKKNMQSKYEKEIIEMRHRFGLD